MKKKILVTLSVIACALLLVVGSVVGTFAYLTSQATVSNTFTVGKVVITLDETKVDSYGVALTGEQAGRVDGTNNPANTYKLIPGHEYTKDPIIHVDATSESAWLFVKIQNEIDSIDLDNDENDEEDGSIADQLTANGWECIDETNNVWAHKSATTALTAADVTTFSTVTIKGDADLTGMEGKTIIVTAYAVQADGFASATAAWNDTFGASSN